MERLDCLRLFFVADGKVVEIQERELYNVSEVIDRGTKTLYVILECGSVRHIRKDYSTFTYTGFVLKKGYKKA